MLFLRIALEVLRRYVNVPDKTRIHTFKDLRVSLGARSYGRVVCAELLRHTASTDIVVPPCSSVSLNTWRMIAYRAALFRTSCEILGYHSREFQYYCLLGFYAL